MFFFLLLASCRAYNPTLPRCQALSPEGYYFDWTALNSTFQDKYTSFGFKNTYQASICGPVSSWAEECSTRCSFCDATSPYPGCVGFYDFGEGNQASWYAVNGSYGTIVSQRNFRDATVDLYCDPTVPASSPVHSATDLYRLSYRSKAICPIGKCPGACNFFQGFGSCGPDSGFLCDCNVGFTGLSCSVPLFASSKSSGNYTTGMIAGGIPVVVSVDLFTVSNQQMPCYKSELPFKLDPSANFTFVECVGAGSRIFSFSSTTAGIATVSLGLYGSIIDGAPFDIIVSPSAMFPNASVASGQGLSSAQVNTDSSFTLQLRDRFNNNQILCSSDASNFAGALYGPKSASVTFTCSEGILTGTYTLSSRACKYP